ncbi:MAG: histidine kinase [Pseudoxanthomonas sp.]
MPATHSPEPWLPDFCRSPRILVMLGLAELVVVLLALVPDGGRRMTPAQFLSASAFALWLAAAVTAMLCLSRQWISRLPVRLGGVLALATTAAMVVFAAGVVYALYAAAGPMPFGVGFWRFSLGSAAVAVLIVALALRYFYVSDRWAAQVNANARAEADALQARIRPHFLFNSMNLIAGLVRRDPLVAEQAVLDLSDLFRAALGAGEGGSTLQQEVELARRYLAIESLRLGEERLRIDWRLHEPLPWSLPMPRLVLQPLVENAVLHGISRLPEGGCVELELQADADELRIRIENPAPATRPEVATLQSGAGHAQRSIAWRLSYAFGPRARLDGEWEEGRYRCRIVLPLPR